MKSGDVVHGAGFDPGSSRDPQRIALQERVPLLGHPAIIDLVDEHAPMHRIAADLDDLSMRVDDLKAALEGVKAVARAA